MFWMLFGTVCLFGVLGTVAGGRRRRRCHRGRHEGHDEGPGWGRHTRGRKRGRAGIRRAFAEVFKRRLDVDEDQEGLVDHALADLAEALSEYRAVLDDSRPELADAFRDEAIDDAALAALFARHDDERDRTRRAVVSALVQVHAVLDPEQRARAADWLSGPMPSWGF